MANQVSKKAVVVSILGSIAAILFPSSAEAMRFHFTQGGFEEGAEISGFFVGKDLNGDGQILFDSFDPKLEEELKEFKISWSGNSMFPAFTRSLNRPGEIFAFGFAYNLNDQYLGDDDGNLPQVAEGIAAVFDFSSFRVFYSAGLGPLEDETPPLTPICQGGSTICGALENDMPPLFSFTTTEFVEVDGPQAIPTPMLLPGLVGMGAAALRRRQQEAQA